MTILQQPAPAGANPCWRVAVGLGGLLALGALFSLANVSLVRAANAAINVTQLSAPVPATDPFSPLWNKAAPADIPLSAQQMYQPGGGSVPAVQVRAVQDGRRVAFLVSWADATRDDNVTDRPSDAAAIELPIDPHNLPYQCMGQSSNRVNIWQWKAALEAVGTAAGQPHSGTRNLTSNGMGKAVETEGVVPSAAGTWRDGRWYVIYSRDLADADLGTAPLLPGETTNAAFAVWDGGKGETRAMKAVSTWTPVQFGEPGGGSSGNWLVVAVAGLAAAAVLTLAWRIIPH